jgi:hypothetical protein
MHWFRGPLRATGFGFRSCADGSAQPISERLWREDMGVKGHKQQAVEDCCALACSYGSALRAGERMRVPFRRSYCSPVERLRQPESRGSLNLPPAPSSVRLRRIHELGVCPVPHAYACGDSVGAARFIGCPERRARGKIVRALSRTILQLSFLIVGGDECWMFVTVMRVVCGGLLVYCHGYASAKRSDCHDYAGVAGFGFARVFGFWNAKEPFAGCFFCGWALPGCVDSAGSGWEKCGNLWDLGGSAGFGLSASSVALSPSRWPRLAVRDGGQRGLRVLCGSVALSPSRWPRLAVRDRGQRRLRALCGSVALAPSWWPRLAVRDGGQRGLRALCELGSPLSFQVAPSRCARRGAARASGSLRLGGPRSFQVAPSRCARRGAARASGPLRLGGPRSFQVAPSRCARLGAAQASGSLRLGGPRSFQGGRSRPGNRRDSMSLAISPLLVDTRFPLVSKSRD